MRSINHLQRGAKLAPLVAAVAFAVDRGGRRLLVWHAPGAATAVHARWRRPLPSRPRLPMRAPARKVLYWHDPMVPGQKFDKPGKRPFMDMDLVPVYADEAPSGGVAISARQRRTSACAPPLATEGTLETGFTAVGAVGVDERSTHRGAGAQPRLRREAARARAVRRRVGAGSRWPSSTCPIGSRRRRNCWRSRRARKPDVAQARRRGAPAPALLGMPDGRDRANRARRQAVGARHGDGAAMRHRVGNRRARRHGGHAGHDAVQARGHSARCG